MYFPGVAGIDCDDIPEVYTQDLLDEIRGDCTTIEDDLWLGSNWTGNANLAGIEEIKGDLFLFSCSAFGYIPPDDPCDPVTDRPIGVSAPDLRVVTGSIEKPPGAPVRSLNFPKLQSAARMKIYDEGNVEDFDVTDLNTIQCMYLTGFEKLETIKSNGIQNFTCDSWLCGITITGSSGLRSIGDLLAVNETIVRGRTQPSLSFTDEDAVLNNSALTIGWSNIRSLGFSGADMKVQLGGPNTTEMFFDYLDLSPDTVLTRHDNVKNITVGKVEVRTSSERYEEMQSFETLNLPFDMVRELFIRTGPDTGSSVQHFSLPEKARDWDGVQLYLGMHDTEFRGKDEDGETLWYWPRKIANVTMNGKINMDIL